MVARHKTTITTPHGLRTCFEARVERNGRNPLVSRFGGIPLKRQKNAIINDRVPGQVTYPRKELIRRLLAGRCEICKQKDNVQVHHVRKLADLSQPGSNQPAWAKIMAKMRRKALVVCIQCHDQIHAESPTAIVTE
jgi:hypothetical protein